MNWKRMIISMVFTVLVLAQYEGDILKSDDPRYRPPLIGSVPNQERGPSFSSPRVEMAPNGDRVSPYPPGYHPEQSHGHGHGHR